MKKILLLFLIGMLALAVTAQQIDLLIAGGHVIDPKNGRNGLMDVAIKDGKILQVAPRIDPALARQVVDAKGLYVVPGLIDIHGHHFWGTREDAYLKNSYSALPPDGFTFRAGVTTVVDAGSPGWRNFRIFKKQTIDKSQTRVLAFLNIVGRGMSGGAIEQDLADMDPKLTAMVAKQYADYIVGIKLAHYYGPEWIPTERAVEAGRQAGIPVMVDFGGYDPPLSLETLLMEKLRPGDILTHCYAHVDRRIPVVDEQGKLRPFTLQAQRRGVIFDVGHGGGSFRFDQAIPAIKQGLKPNSISTDLHTGSMNAGMKNMLNVMSKFLNMDLSLQEVITAATWNPARIIQREELGHLSEGAVADVAVLRLHTGSFGFVDVVGMKIMGDQKLECELTLREGRVVWDLNGISRPLYQEK
ncbi:MAG: amidohydrolase/deacetylase family metallohydrolase [Bacteroidetes bacterium]|nr:MAG: amidohydrolase/deacetylase family metallohydrolase [Bacteroidota bacterium]